MQPATSLVVGYEVDDDLDAFFTNSDDFYLLSDRTRKLSGKALDFHHGSTGDPDCPQYDFRRLFLGISVCSTYGDPDTSSFTAQDVADRLEALERLAAKNRNLCRELHAAFPCIPEGLMSQDPIVALLFSQGDGQAAGDLYLGIEGRISHDGSAWKLAFPGDEQRSRTATEAVNARFGSDFPEYPRDALSEIAGWFDTFEPPYKGSIHRLNPYADFASDGVGFFFGSGVCSLLEGGTEHRFTREALEALSARLKAMSLPQARFWLRSERYGC